MKTIFRIFGVLALLIAWLTCSMPVDRTGTEKGKPDTQQTDLPYAQAKLALFKTEVEKMTEPATRTRFALKAKKGAPSVTSAANT